MKKLSLLLVAFFLSAIIIAQAPQKMSYQCIVRNSTGNLVTNQPIGLKISILKETATGDVVYSETYNPNPQTNANGLLTVEIGSGLKISGDFPTIDWSTGLFFLKTETDPTGGTNYTVYGTSQLLSVPFALYAQNAGGRFSGDYDDLINKPTILNNELRTTATGFEALKVNTGIRNVAYGYRALTTNSTGEENAAIGNGALFSNTTGSRNIAIGTSALADNTLGQRNVALGPMTLSNNTEGQGNIAIGNGALFANITGNYNIAIGDSPLGANRSGGENIAIGFGALAQGNNCLRNVAIGVGAMSIAVGSENIAIGNDALWLITSGRGNTVIGVGAGGNLRTGDNNTCIGTGANPSTEGSNNEIVLGNSSNTVLRCNVPYITTLSDERDKTNISDLSIGIEFLMNVKPRQFNWDRREWYQGMNPDGSKMQKVPTAGFVAQELDALQKATNTEWLNLVLKDNPDKMEITPGNLLPVLVKAIQDQQSEIEELKKEIAFLKTNLKK